MKKKKICFGFGKYFARTFIHSLAWPITRRQAVCTRHRHQVYPHDCAPNASELLINVCRKHINFLATFVVAMTQFKLTYTAGYSVEASVNSFPIEINKWIVVIEWRFSNGPSLHSDMGNLKHSKLDNETNRKYWHCAVR